MTNKTPHNATKSQLIRDMQFEMKEAWGFSEVETGIIISAFIGKIRRSLGTDYIHTRSGEFKELCYEIYQISKTWPDHRKKSEILKDFS
jgi:hypothetical protein